VYRIFVEGVIIQIGRSYVDTVPQRRFWGKSMLTPIPISPHHLPSRYSAKLPAAKDYPFLIVKVHHKVVFGDF
jgi:hypothetical protein